MSSSDEKYALDYDFSTLGQFQAPHPKYNLKDLPPLACSLAYKEAAEVERVVSQIWKRNFVAFYSGKGTDTQAYIFTDAPRNANLIVLAFRGSEKGRDWFLNFRTVQTALFFGRGAVHKGFWDALSFGYDEVTVYKPGNQKEFKKGPMFDPILDTLLKLKREHSKAKILVTGHSLGGAVALIFTLKYDWSPLTDASATDSASYKLMTFGQPKVGNLEFCNFMTALKLNYSRVVNPGDGVPTVPPGFPPLRIYSHCGEAVPLSPDGRETVEPRGFVIVLFHDHQIEEYVRRVKASLRREGRSELVKTSAAVEEEEAAIVALQERMLRELQVGKRVDDDSHSAVTTQP